MTADTLCIAAAMLVRGASPRAVCVYRHLQQCGHRALVRYRYFLYSRGQSQQLVSLAPSPPCSRLSWPRGIIIIINEGGAALRSPQNPRQFALKNSLGTSRRSYEVVNKEIANAAWAT